VIASPAGWRLVPPPFLEGDGRRKTMSTITLGGAAVFENVDRLSQVEMRTQGLPVGVIGRLYAIARRDEEPLALRAAAALRAPSVGRVACVTGIAGGPLPRGEVDGPIGAAALANALVDIGKSADVVVPEAMVQVVEALRRAMNGDFGVVPEIEAVPDGYDAAVTVEKLGRNRKGVFHSIFGAPLEDQAPTGDEFVEALNRAGKLTIGIGDGGNEIGFGAIFDQAREIVPHGMDCGCPCHDGIVTSTATRIVYPASVSNFGAYAITTALGILEEKPLLLASQTRIAAAVEAAVTQGCLDGGTFEPGRLADDGIPIDGVMAYVTLLRSVACQHFRSTPRHA
jgi:D-glutamate cyclase